MNTMHTFNFQSRSWSKRELKGGHEGWAFGHAAKRDKSLFAFGVQAVSESGPTPVEVTALPLYPTVRKSNPWRRLKALYC